MPKLSKKEQHALLEVAKEVGRLCEKNKETKADTESTEALQEHKQKQP